MQDLRDGSIDLPASAKKLPGPLLRRQVRPSESHWPEKAGTQRLGLL